MNQSDFLAIKKRGKHRLYMERLALILLICLKTGARFVIQTLRVAIAIIIPLYRAVFKWLSKNQNQITPTNHNRSRERGEPITIPANYL